MHAGELCRNNKCTFYLGLQIAAIYQTKQLWLHDLLILVCLFPSIPNQTIRFSLIKDEKAAQVSVKWPSFPQTSDQNNEWLFSEPPAWEKLNTFLSVTVKRYTALLSPCPECCTEPDILLLTARRSSWKRLPGVRRKVVGKAEWRKVRKFNAPKLLTRI